MGISDFLKKVKTEAKVVTGQAAKDKLFESQRIYKEKAEALKGFQLAKEKLFDVNKWSNLPGVSAGFKMFTREGAVKASGSPEVGDFIKIDLPGPTPETWVEVIDRKEEKESAEFTVSPSPDPREKGEEVRDVEHFFDDDATSTFQVMLQGTTLYAYEIGKEETPNNKSEKAGGMGVINTIISVGGWLAFQEMQWNKLTDYLVHHIDLDVR